MTGYPIGPLCRAWVIDAWRETCPHQSCDRIVDGMLVRLARQRDLL